MLSLLPSLPSYNKGDQGFLNAFFSGWFHAPSAHRLPARYNAVLFFPPHYHPPDWFAVDEAHEALRGPLMVVHFANPWFKPWRLGGGMGGGTGSSVDKRESEGSDGEGEREGDSHTPSSSSSSPQSVVDAAAEAYLREAVKAAAKARTPEARRERQRKSYFHTPHLSVLRNNGKTGDSANTSSSSSSSSGGEGSAVEMNLWVALWLHLARALEANQWHPLDPSSLSLLQFLRNADDYDALPDAHMRPKYSGGGFDRLGRDLEGAGDDEDEIEGGVVGGVEAEGHAAHERKRRKEDLPVIPPRPHFIGREAFVTVITRDNYFAAGVWATSFAQHHSFSHWRKTLLLVLSSVPRQHWQPLRALFNEVRVVDPIVVGGRQLADEFAILHVWGQQGFDKVAFVHPLAAFCDNANELLLAHDAFAAPPAVFPPDMFSSRVMVIQPNITTFRDMIRKLSVPRFPTASIDLFLNGYYSDWFSSGPSHRIIPSYNVDLWFKEGLMKFFIPWRIVVFDPRAPPWGNISDWMAHDRTKAVKLWRRTFCLMDEHLQPTKLRPLCADLLSR